ncbi:head GIN domain-containing protein [Nitrosococcus wardiae]|uniref:DUF2807 domain-containing protein n=1 Tax=Nitrosococcus wardiae TaxID=1814290 RepID=A0A4P7C0Q4_9GAMM|nr:head GIN domain-containing protein [Nitrosococcus wardiae]QBQ55179.1 DUF2807 domain-containing protein [Nitrosococcus wardiae]
MNKYYGVLAGIALGFFCVEPLKAEAVTGKIVIDGNVYGDDVVRGNHQPSVVRRPLPCFDQITVQAGVDLVYLPGDDCGATLDADSNLHPIIETEVGGDILNIAARRSFQTEGPVQVEARSPSLSRVDILSAADAVLRKLHVPSLVIRVAGSGDVSVQGQVDLLEVIVEGSGTLDLRNLHANHAKVFAGGAADVVVYAAKSLKVNVTGAGDILYYGRPARVEKNISGAGNVEAAE